MKAKRAAASPYAASSKTSNKPSTSSVYSRDPPLTRAKRPLPHDVNHIEVEEIPDEPSRPKLRSATAQSKPSPKQESRRLHIERHCGLKRPATANGEGSSTTAKPPQSSTRRSTSEEEIIETADVQFPIQRTTRDTLSAPHSSGRVRGPGKRAAMVINSSPIRSLNQREKRLIEVSSSEEEEEVEDQHQHQRRLLSPDDEPPKLPPRKAVQVSPATALGMTKKSKMRKRDGSRPFESDGSRRASFPTSPSMPSSKLSTTPAAIQWAMVEVKDGNHVVHADIVSLRPVGMNKDLVLELVGSGNKSASLPLAKVSGLMASPLHATALTPDQL